MDHPITQRSLFRVSARVLTGVIAGLLILGLPVTHVSAASSWNPTLLVNTESFSTIDDGDSTTNIELRFGDTLQEKLYFNRSASRFQLTRGLFIQGNLTATGSLSVRGTMSGASLRVDQSADIWGNLGVSGSTVLDGATTINNTLDTTGAITTDGNLTINEDNGAADATLTFGNDSGAETVKFNDTTNRFEVSDDVSITGTLATSDMISGSGGLAVTNDINTRANLKINGDNGAADAVITFGNDAGAETMQFNDTTNEFDLSDDLNVTGTLDASGDITGSGNLAIEGTIGADGSISTNTNLAINADNGGADATLTFGNDAGAETIKFNDTTNRFELSDDVSITGTLDASGNISGSGNLSIDGTMHVDGAATFGSTIRVNGVTYTFPYGDGSASGKVLKTNGAGQLTWSADIDTNTNAQTLCGADEYLDGDGNCVDVIEEGELTNESTLETQLGSINVLVGTELDSFSELQAQVVETIMSQTTGDNRYVNRNGDSMTGSLTIGNGGGLNASGSLLTNTNITLNSDNGAADAVLTFGNDAGAETIRFNDTTNRFEVSDDFKAAGNISGSTLTVDGTVTIRGVAYTFPTSAGSNGQVMTTDGAGALTWSDSTVGTGSGGALFMSPEYPHAVYFGSGSTYIGQLSYSYDTTNKENYYHWTSTKAALNDYWISVQVRVPQNFSVWDANQPLTFKYKTGSADTAVNYANIRMLDTAGSLVALSAGLLANTSWTTATITGPQAAGTYTPGGYITLLIKVATTSAGSTDIGSIGVNWETTAP